MFGALRDWVPMVAADEASGVAWAGGWVGEGVAAAFEDENPVYVDPAFAAAHLRLAYMESLVSSNEAASGTVTNAFVPLNVLAAGQAPSTTGSR